MRRLLAFFIALALVAALTVTVSAHSAPVQNHRAATQQNVVRATTGKPAREVFGYALSGSLGDPSWGYTTWDWSILGTVAYFALHIADNGTIVSDSDWTTWNSSVVTGMIGTAHASGAKVLVTIDLQDFSPGTPYMCGGLTNSTTTVQQTAATVVARGVDGVSVDYEGLNGTCPNGQTSRAMMTSFVQQLRGELGPGYYVSVSTYASSASDSLGFFDVASMSPYVDSFFVMAYDLEYSNYRYAPIYCASFCLGPTAPLAGYRYNDTTTASEYTSVVPASKVLLGVPYYGRKACVPSAALNPYPSGPVTADTYLDWVSEPTDPSVLPGSYASHVDPNDPAGQESWNNWYNTSLGCERELYIDDAASLGKKYDLVNADGLRGVGIWTLNYGGSSPELWAALRGHFATCTSVSAGSSVVPPQPIGVVTQVNAAATGCSNPLYQFWLLPPGGTWRIAQAYSSSASFNWATAGSTSGTYLFSVWARASGSQNSYDSFGTFNFALKPACTAVTVTTSPLTSAPIGTSVSLTASAAGCGSPSFAVWVLPPQGGWMLARAYGTNPAFSWATTGRGAGSYRFSVWARDAASGNSYDALNTFLFSLTPVCTSVAASEVPSTAAGVGNTVTVSASSSGCPSPLYEFWVLPPGGTWTMAQAYSSSSTFKWPTAGLASGHYVLSIWARDSTSTNSYDALQAVDYTLVPMCAAVTATTLPASTAGVGNTITITATASGCASPLYEFWVLAPGGTWTLVQPYSSSGVLKWPTAGKAKGSYMIAVWVRDAGSPGYRGTPPYTYDALSAFSYVLV